MSQYTEQELHKGETDSLYTQLYEAEQLVAELRLQNSLLESDKNILSLELKQLKAEAEGLKWLDRSVLIERIEGFWEFAQKHEIDPPYSVETLLNMYVDQLQAASVSTAISIEEIASQASLSVGLKMYDNPKMSAVEATVRYMIERFGIQTA